ncbi:hypothetical protein ACFYY8_41955 [Streptosporangium sp. NPDC001559]|uniref:hypothetical protein n=1 Tax=Streptosporangium sp. NPDC001559 TaxID=3366187 RepID=UPI0036E273F8
MSKVRTSALALLSAAGLVLAASPAQAQPAQAMGNAPGCVTVWQKAGTFSKTGYAKNNCNRTLRLKIVWKYGGDSQCKSVRRGQTLSHKVPRVPRKFDGANSC